MHREAYLYGFSRAASALRYYGASAYSMCESARERRKTEVFLKHDAKRSSEVFGWLDGLAAALGG